LLLQSCFLVFDEVALFGFLGLHLKQIPTYRLLLLPFLDILQKLLILCFQLFSFLLQSLKFLLLSSNLFFPSIQLIFVSFNAPGNILLEIAALFVHLLSDFSFIMAYFLAYLVFL
jgi:hypothetical protein